MSSTIKSFLTARWVSPSGKEYPFPDESAEIVTTTTGDNSLMHEQNLTTVPVAMVKGDVGAGGVLFIHNPNVSGNVILDSGAAGVNVITVRPGDTHKTELHADITAPRLSMSTGTGRVTYRITDA